MTRRLALVHFLGASLALGLGCATEPPPPPAAAAPPPAEAVPEAAPAPLAQASPPMAAPPAGVVAGAAAGAPEPGLEVWAQRHPEASRELGQWVRSHPRAAQRLFEWDGRHPEKSRELVYWAISHPQETIDAFVATHPGWPGLDQLLERHRPAAEAFLFWCRRHVPAAQELMVHSHALEWAGHHLYAEVWQLERPRR